jgi:hypothetical protein
MNPNQTVKAAFVNQIKQMNVNYRTPVNTSLLFWPHQYFKSRSVPGSRLKFQKESLTQSNFIHISSMTGIKLIVGG